MDSKVKRFLVYFFIILASLALSSFFTLLSGLFYLPLAIILMIISIKWLWRQRIIGLGIILILALILPLILNLWARNYDEYGKYEGEVQTRESWASKNLAPWVMTLTAVPQNCMPSYYIDIPGFKAVEEKETWREKLFGKTCGFM